MKRILSFGVLLLVLAACGGGDDATDPLQDPTGVWIGSYRVTPTTTMPTELMGVVWDGRWMFFYDDYYYSSSDMLYEGNPVVTGHFFEGDLKYYLFNSFILSRYFDGTVITEERIAGETDYDDGEHRGYLSMSYSDLTARGASLTVLESNWSETKSYITTTLSIDSAGVVHGSDTDGCIYNGTIQAPNTDKNIYEIGVNVSTCGELDGDYSGLGFTSGPTNDWLEFSISNLNHFMNLTLIRV